MDENGSLLTLECFERKYRVISDFLEYGVVCLKINKFLELRERPLYSIENPTDCMLNVILRKDTKGVSSIYGMLLSKTYSVIEIACTKLE